MTPLVLPGSSSLITPEQLEVITTEEPGCGHNPARQEASHPHQCVAYKNKFIFVPNLGIDRIQVYKVEESGKVKAEPLCSDK